MGWLRTSSARYWKTYLLLFIIIVYYYNGHCSCCFFCCLFYSASSMYSIVLMDDWWMMNLKGLGRKVSWSNLSTRPQNTCQDIWYYPGQDSNWALPEHKFTTLLLHQRSESCWAAGAAATTICQPFLAIKVVSIISTVSLFEQSRRVCLRMHDQCHHQYHNYIIIKSTLCSSVRFGTKDCNLFLPFLVLAWRCGGTVLTH